jgi:hypothetical protein
MKRFNTMNKIFKPSLLAGAVTLALVAGPAMAEVYDLCAVEGTKTLPDGSSVPVWGYAQDTGAGCPTTPEIPGPELTVTDGILTINLVNNLPEPTSIVIPGLPMPASVGSGPTWNFGPAGARTDPAQRVRSFGAEATSGGGSESYAWTGIRPGTFVYHSGTHPQKQVYMGLYGAVTQNAVEADAGLGTPAEAYAGVPYDNQVVLFYSDLDPDHNNSIYCLNYPGSVLPNGLTCGVDVMPYTTSIHYHPSWFLIDGEPYSEACTDLNPADGFDDTSGYPCANMVQTPDITTGPAKTRTLLRFLSAAGKTHVPTLQGLHMSIHAEDALPYGWEDTDPAALIPAGAAPREQYSVMLPPLKTKDAVIEPQLEGTYAIYDGNGYMTNPTDPEDFSLKDVVGGMLRFLAVAPDGNLPPVGNPDLATVVENGTITIDVLANDSDPEGQPLTIAAMSAATAGTATCDIGVIGGTCEYTAPAGAGDQTFTYDVSDGVNTTTGVLVTVTVEANVAPIANPDTDTTDSATPVTLNVLANDVGQPGETLAIATFDATSANGATVSCDTVTGDCTYTPDGVFTGADTFTYTATDGTLNSTPATVTITVDPVAGNTPPVAVDDPYNVIEDGILSIAAPGVLGNDTDADGDPLTATLVSGPTNAAAFSFQTTGAFFYQPNPNFTGTDTFTYLANDGTADSNVATVTITVDPGNDIPVANDDTFFLKSMYDTGQLTTVDPAGVLANDTDPDGDPLTAILDPDPAVEPPAELILNPDGSFTYTTGNIENEALGTVDSFTYFANDGSVNSAAPATVNLVRKLTVGQAVCERRNNGRCDWRIQGSKLEAATARVQAYIAGTGTLIGQTPPNVGAEAWNISVNNSTVNLTLQPIDVRVQGDADAEIQAYPVTEQ